METKIFPVLGNLQFFDSEHKLPVLNLNNLFLCHHQMWRGQRRKFNNTIVLVAFTMDEAVNTMSMEPPCTSCHVLCYDVSTDRDCPPAWSWPRRCVCRPAPAATSPPGGPSRRWWAASSRPRTPARRPASPRPPPRCLELEFWHRCTSIFTIFRESAHWIGAFSLLEAPTSAFTIPSQMGRSVCNYSWI